MAAPTENLLSLGHLTGTERNTFTKRRERSLKNSRVMFLQQRWQELKERELTAQQHNRQLLQQFEKTQDTLREMLARNAAMKTIRMEYERYLEESAPRWQQQLKEKTQAAQRKRMEECLRSCLKKTEQEQMTNPSADRPLLSHSLTKKPQKVSTPQEKNQSSHSDYNQDVSSHLPYLQSSWLTHTPSQSARFPIRGPSQPQDSSHVPPSCLPPSFIFPHPHQFQLASTSTHHPPWPRLNPPGWGPPQPDYPCSWTTGAAGIPSGSEALWGQLYMEEPPHDRRVEAETSRAPSSKRERGGGSRSSCFSQELDIKPVRLSSGHAESSESGRDSSQASREKRKRREKRGKPQRTSSERSSLTPSADVVAGVTVVHGSESDTSSEKRSSGRTSTRSGGLAAGSPRMEEVPNKRTRSKGGDSGSDKEKSRSTSEESVSQAEESRSENVLNGSDEKSHSWREEESGSFSTETENGVSEKDQQERSSGAEERGEEEEKHKDLGGVDGEEKENTLRNKEEEETDVEEDDDDVCARKNLTEEEEETGAGDELEDQGDDEDSLKNEDDENRTRGSATSQDEEEYEGESEHEENKIQEEEEGSAEEEEGEGEEEEEEEEQRSDEAGEERDSEDSIISPQENRLKKIHVVPEEAAEDDDHEQKGSKTGSSDEDSDGFSEDDVEDLLAPPQLTQKTQEKDLKVDDKPKATCDNVEIFQVELDNSTKTDHQSDSDEFDHFYD